MLACQLTMLAAVMLTLVRCRQRPRSTKATQLKLILKYCVTIGTYGELHPFMSSTCTRRERSLCRSGAKLHNVHLFVNTV